MEGESAPSGVLNLESLCSATLWKKINVRPESQYVDKFVFRWKLMQQKEPAEVFSVSVSWWDEPLSWSSTWTCSSGKKTGCWTTADKSELLGTALNYSEALCCTEGNRVCDSPLGEHTGGWRMRILRRCSAQRNQATPTREHVENKLEANTSTSKCL